MVAFHADLSEQDDGAHPHTELDHVRYVEMLQMLFASANRFHPGSRNTVLTTRQTNLTALSGEITRMDFEVQAETLMRDRLAAQIQMLAGDALDIPLVLVDSDVLINAPLTEVFTEDFDVGLTWRDLEAMPFNGGVIFLNNHRRGPAEAFLTAVQDVYMKRHRHRTKWFGDQTAMHDYLGVSLDDLRMSSEMEKDGCRYRFFPCDTYNFSPENRASEILRPLDDKAILHFKGARKNLMPHYFNAYLKSGPAYSPRDWLRKRRAQAALRVLAAREAGAHVQADDR